MILPALIFGGMLGMIIVTLQPKLDRSVAWIYAALVAGLAGFRGGGFDYEEYLTIIDNVRATDAGDWALKLFFAKDPIFLLVIVMCGWITSSPVPIFLTMAIAAMAAKVAATHAIPGRRTLFITTYAVFLAPGLEFAAIRSALAVGLLLLALSVTKRQWGWALAAFASHSSSVLAWMGKLLQKHKVVMLVVSVLALPVALPLLLELAADDARYTNYLENQGTVRALFMPICTWIASAAIAVLAARMKNPPKLANREMTAATLVSSTAAVLLAVPSVTVSFRIMEIAWVLMLAQCASLKLTGLQQKMQLLIICVSMASVLIASNILRRTWAVMLGAPA